MRVHGDKAAVCDRRVMAVHRQRALGENVGCDASLTLAA